MKFPKPILVVPMVFGTIMAIQYYQQLKFEEQHQAPKVPVSKIASIQLDQLTSLANASFATEDCKEITRSSVYSVMAGFFNPDGKGLTGLIPHVVADTEAKKLDNYQHKLAMDSLSYSNKASEFLSDVIGELDFSVSNTDCTITFFDKFPE